MKFFKEKKVRWQDYFNLPSEAPLAWLAYLVAALVFDNLRARFSALDQVLPALIFSLLNIAAAIYFLVQIYSNLQNWRNK